MLVLTFEVGGRRFGLDVRGLREVVPWVPLERPPGAPAWLGGLFAYRGRAVPVVDLHRLWGAGECPPHLSSRILLVPAAGTDPGGEPPLVGLLAARVDMLRELTLSDAGPGTPVVLDDGLLHLIDPETLFPSGLRALALNPAGGAP